MPDGMSLQGAAEQLGVHYMTAYRYVRTGRLAATKQAGKWWIDPADLAVLVAGPSPTRGPRSGNPDASAYVDRLQVRLTAGDDTGVWQIINEALVSGASAPDVHTKIIGPCMVQIGDAWAAGDLSIAAEHRASATATRVLGRMTSMFRHPGRRKCSVVLGAVAGDYHTLPTAMLADLLFDAGYEVLDMGPNTPTESFLEAAEEIHGPVIVALCCTVDDALGALAATTRAIRAGLPEIAIFVGGRASEPIAASLPINGHAASGPAAIELFDQYLAG